MSENEYGQTDENTIKMESEYQLSDKSESVIVDPNRNEIVETESEEMAAIRFAATMMGIGGIKSPNPKCKKCSGRGFTGKITGTGQPIPCTCIYTEQAVLDVQGLQQAQVASMNRQQKRKLAKQLKKQRIN